jgi:hypothetical protein
LVALVLGLKLAMKSVPLTPMAAAFVLTNNLLSPWARCFLDLGLTKVLICPLTSERIPGLFFEYWLIIILEPGPIFVEDLSIKSNLTKLFLAVDILLFCETHIPFLIFRFLPSGKNSTAKPLAITTFPILELLAIPELGGRKLTIIVQTNRVNKNCFNLSPFSFPVWEIKITSGVCPPFTFLVNGLGV